MLKLRFRVPRIIIFLILIGCSKSLPNIEGFDARAWKEDGFGCGGNRQVQLVILKENKDLLLGLNQNEMLVVLGPPDEHELYERKQNFFYYYVNPGPDCNQPVLNAVRLQIRFSATGIANEIFFENL